MGRQIEIDLDIHKLVEAARQSFTERPNDILRRLLGLPTVSATLPPVSNDGAEKPAKAPRGWQKLGVFLPAGTRLRMRYNNQLHEGQITSEGDWLVGSVRYANPSAAAIGSATTKEGRRTNLNGWRLWYCLRPGEADWILLDDLQRQATGQREAV